MHGLVLLDAADRVLRPAILWNDQRTAAACDEIRGDDRARSGSIAITGNDALTGFTAPKLVWVRDHEPDVWSPGRPRPAAEGLRPAAPDRRARDRRRRRRRARSCSTWPPGLVAGGRRRRSRIDPAWLPAVFEGPAITGPARPPRRPRQRGSRAGTPVIAGGGDQAANAVGARAPSTRGRRCCRSGRPASIFAADRAPIVEPRGRVHAFCHAVPGRWHLMSVMLSAAGSLRWFRDTLAPGEAFGD